MFMFYVLVVVVVVLLLVACCCFVVLVTVDQGSGSIMFRLSEPSALGHRWAKNSNSQDLRGPARTWPRFAVNSSL